MRRATRSGSLARTWRRGGGTSAWVVLFATGAVRAASAQEMSATIDRQVILLTTIVQFDRSFADRAGHEVVVAVLYEKDAPSSVAVHDRIRARLALEPRVAGRPLRLVSVEMEPGRSPVQALSDAGANIVYVPPLERCDLVSVVEAARLLDVLSVTGVPGYVAQGVSIGFEAVGSEPEILINLEASREEGARFSSELLRLSRVLGSARPR